MKSFYETVGSEISLLQFIKSKSKLSNKAIKKLLESHFCKVNGRVEHFGSRGLHVGEKVEWQELTEKIIDKNPKVLFENSDFLIVHKLPKTTSESIPALFSPSYMLAHRLDKETSGALLIAKSKVSLDALTDLFRKKQVEKHYVAIASGPIRGSGQVRNFLVKLREYQGQSCYGSAQNGGLLAVTDYRVLKKSGSIALVLLKPLTGRTHQIRVHLSELGSPIVGDYQYGYQGSGLLGQRVFLHALQLSFEWKGEKILVKAEMPGDFLSKLNEVGIACKEF